MSAVPDMASVGLRGWRLWAGLLMVSLVGAAAVVCAAQARMGMNTDGTAYFGTARCVMAGEGPRWPYGAREEDLRWSVHFPPLFALVAGDLSLLLGVSDPRVTVTYLHGLLLAAAIVLTAWMVRRHTGSGWWALGGAVFLVLTADVLDAYASFMSEPLFIFLGMAGLVAVDTAGRLGGDRRGKRRWLAALGLAFVGGGLIGAAYWCRYAGIALMAAAGAGLLLYPGMSWRRRLVLAGVAGLPMLAGLLGLSEYVYLATHALASRCLRFQPDQLVYVAAMVWIPFQWVLPITAKVYPMVLAAAGFFCGVVMVARGLRRPEAGDQSAEPLTVQEQTPDGGEGAPAMPIVFVSAAVFYAALMVVSAVCVDPPATPFEPRLLVPWLPMLVVLGAWALRRRMAASWGAGLARAGLVTMLVAIGIGNSPRLWERLRGEEQFHVGYAANWWHDSGTALWVRQHVPADALIFCNRCDGLYYLTNRNSVWVPKSHAGGGSGRTGGPRPEFGEEVDRMCQEMRRNDGFLVCFDDTWAEGFGMASPKELMGAVREGALVVEAVTNDGTIYRWEAGTQDDGTLEPPPVAMPGARTRSRAAVKSRYEPRGSLGIQKP